LAPHIFPNEEGTDPRLPQLWEGASFHAHGALAAHRVEGSNVPECNKPPAHSVLPVRTMRRISEGKMLRGSGDKI
jgi:hypothetical protein